MSKFTGSGTQVETCFAPIGGTEKPFLLAEGTVLPEAVVAYETYGELAAERDNAILLFHALSGSQHAAGFNPAVAGVTGLWTEDCRHGWWNAFIGPGRALDTDRFFVICANYLGSCYGSSGPCSNDPATGRPYGAAFPWIKTTDIVASQLRLLDFLGVDRLHAAVGASIGGLLCLELALHSPGRVGRLVPIATGMETTVLQRIHNFEQICAIEADAAFAGGGYAAGAGPQRGLALARMISHKTFVSLAALESRARSDLVTGAWAPGTYRIEQALESYMLHQGWKFVARFDANAYLRIIAACQNFSLAAYVKDAAQPFAACRDQEFLIFSIDSDVAYYPEEQERLASALKQSGVAVQHITVHSDKGHDSFLVEPEFYTPYLAHFLQK